MIDSISLMALEIYQSKVVEFVVYRDAIMQIVNFAPHISLSIRNIQSTTEGKIIESEISDRNGHLDIFFCMI